MKHQVITLVAAACCAFAGTSFAMDKAEYKAQKDKVEADYKASKASCDPMKGNAKDVCKVEAKGNYNVAKASLEAQHAPSPAHDKKVASEKADAAYDLAKQKCDDLKAAAKDNCKKEAKAAHTTAMGGKG